jgi:hypothetical protein
LSNILVQALKKTGGEHNRVNGLCKGVVIDADKEYNISTYNFGEKPRTLYPQQLLYLTIFDCQHTTENKSKNEKNSIVMR